VLALLDPWMDRVRGFPARDLSPKRRGSGSGRDYPQSGIDNLIFADISAN